MIRAFLLPRIGLAGTNQFSLNSFVLFICDLLLLFTNIRKVDKIFKDREFGHKFVILKEDRIFLHCKNNNSHSSQSIYSITF